MDMDVDPVEDDDVDVVVAAAGEALEAVENDDVVDVVIGWPKLLNPIVT